jgi:hypothetical protein
MYQPKEDSEYFSANLHPKSTSETNLLLPLGMLLATVKTSVSAHLDRQI